MAHDRTARVLLGGDVEPADGVPAKQVLAAHLPLGRPAEYRLQERQIGLDGRGAHLGLLVLRHLAASRSNAPTGTSPDEFLPLLSGNLVRLLLRPQKPPPQLTPSLVGLLRGLGLLRRPVLPVEAEHAVEREVTGSDRSCHP